MLLRAGQTIRILPVRTNVSQQPGGVIDQKGFIGPRTRLIHGETESLRRAGADMQNRNAPAAASARGN